MTVSCLPTYIDVASFHPFLPPSLYTNVAIIYATDVTDVIKSSYKLKNVAVAAVLKRPRPNDKPLPTIL